MLVKRIEGGDWEHLADVTLGNTRLLLDIGSGPPMLDPGWYKPAREPLPPADGVIFGSPRQDLAALLDGCRT